MKLALAAIALALYIDRRQTQLHNEHSQAIEFLIEHVAFLDDLPGDQ